MCHLCEETQPRLSRRRLMKGGIALAGLAAGLGSLPRGAAAQAQNEISPDAALSRILAGNDRYVANASLNRDFAAGRADRAVGQYPIAALVSCADARVAPELIFDQGPGDLFVTRVAGNFVYENNLASLEYGVKFLGVPLIMVLGHSSCGAVDATIKVVKDGAVLPGHLPELVTAMKPGIEAAIAKKPDDLLDAAIRENVRHNVGVLQSAGPIVSELVAAGKVKVVGGFYDIASGKVSVI